MLQPKDYVRIVGPYYYGKHKWDNYLLDIQDSINLAEDTRRKGGRFQEEAAWVAHEQLDELRHQTQELRCIKEALNSGFEGLRAEFEWGFTLMVDRMDAMIDHLSQIAAKLDAIHRTLQSPLLTQARELFQLGQEHFRKGLLDKALEAYLKAEQKNEVDFPLQLQIGKLYLYGRDEDDDVIDLPKAEKHLLLAARYADAEKTTFPLWKEYCGQAYFHAAVAAYLIGEQEQAAGRRDGMRACLERALGYLTKAAALWPRFTEIVYTQAKCHAVLGQTQDATRKLEILSDRDRRYFEKASRDGDFKGFFADIDELFRRATVSPGPLARATQVKLDKVEQAIAWAKRSLPTSQEDLTIVDSIVTDLSAARGMPDLDTTRLSELPTRLKIEQVMMAVDASVRELSLAKRSLRTLEVDIEGLGERLTQIGAEMEKLAAESFRGMSGACAQVISSFQQRKTACEGLIQQENDIMRYTSGAGIGCLFFLLFSAGAGTLFYLGLTTLLPLVPQFRASPAGGAVAGLVFFGGTMAASGMGAVMGSKISRNYKNRHHRVKIEEYSITLAECDRKLIGLHARAEAWKGQARKFEAWQNLQSL